MRVLFVEDRTSTAHYLQNVFAEHEPSWRLTWVSTAEECVRRGLAGKYEVVLIDENLQHASSGIAACRELRRFGCTALLLVFAADDSDIARQCAHDAGADAFLSKALVPRELLARIREHVFRPPFRNVRECGPLRLDIETMQVTVDGRRVAVTPAEWHIVLDLITLPGRCRSRERLCKVAEIQPGDQYKTLQTHIAILRNKLGKAGELIETIRGEGYRLVPPRWAGFQRKGEFDDAGEI